MDDPRIIAMKLGQQARERMVADIQRRAMSSGCSGCLALGGTCEWPTTCHWRGSCAYAPAPGVGEPDQPARCGTCADSLAPCWLPGKDCLHRPAHGERAPFNQAELDKLIEWLVDAAVYFGSERANESARRDLDESKAELRSFVLAAVGVQASAPLRIHEVAWDDAPTTYEVRKPGRGTADDYEPGECLGVFETRVEAEEYARGVREVPRG